MKQKEVYLFSKIFYESEKEDPDYLDTIAIKSLLETNNIPYTNIPNKSHTGDPVIKLENKTYNGIKELRDNLLVLIDYFHPNLRS